MIKDYQLFIVVSVLLFIDLAFMLTWQISDPFYRETKQLGAYVSTIITTLGPKFQLFFLQRRGSTDVKA